MARPPANLGSVAWTYHAGSPWRDLPDELGFFRTAHKRLLRWAMDGTGERTLDVLAAAEGADDIGWTVSVDSTCLPSSPARRWSQETRGPCPAVALTGLGLPSSSRGLVIR